MILTDSYVKTTDRVTMKPDLMPLECLSQVVFFSDYIQLVFQDSIYSIYNEIELHQAGGNAVVKSDLGFSDHLVALIGKTLESVASDESLALTFEGGDMLVVCESGLGPEAWMYTTTDRRVQRATLATPERTLSATVVYR